MVSGYNPQGLNVISSGIALARPPRANMTVLYTIIDTGHIAPAPRPMPQVPASKENNGLPLGIEKVIGPVPEPPQ